MAAEAAKGVDFIKMWVDDEREMIPNKMPYEITKAAIDEAKKHKIKVWAHVYYLEDAKELARQGVDGFAHIVRDKAVDQELIDLMKSKGTWQAASTLSREIVYSMAVMPWINDPFFTRGVTPGTIAALRSPEREKAVMLGAIRVPGLPYEKRLFADMGRTVVQAMDNYTALVKAGVKSGMGTDSGPNGRFPGFNAHEELSMEVMAGPHAAGDHQVGHQRQCRLAGRQDHRQHRGRQVGRPSGAGRRSPGRYPQHQVDCSGLCRGQCRADHLGNLPRPRPHRLHRRLERSYADPVLS